MSVPRYFFYFGSLLTLITAYQNQFTTAIPTFAIPEGAGAYCQSELQACASTLQTNMLSHVGNNSLMCQDIDVYGQCVGRTSCGMSQAFIDQRLLETKNQLRSQGTLSCKGNTNQIPTFVLPDGASALCQYALQACESSLKSNVLSHVGNDNLMCRDIDVYGQCVGRTSCGLSQSFIDQKLQETKNQLKSQGTLNCGGNQNQIQNPVPPMVLPEGASDVCQSEFEACESNFKSNVLSHVSDDYLMCRDIDVYGQCIWRTSCGVSQSFIDQKLQEVKNKLKSRGTLNCGGNLDQIPTAAVPGGPNSQCQDQAKMCLSEFYMDVMRDDGDSVLLCRDIDIYGKCLWQSSCGVSSAYINQQLQSAKNMLNSQGILDCASYGSMDGQAGLLVTGAIVWLSVAAMFLATKLPDWL